MRRQVEASQFEQAWATAQAHPQLIGDVHFDFLYGVAAINTGHVAEGLLALERHLAQVPANDRARLELARGYFLLGEYTRARTEFEFVLRYNPPAGVRQNIAGFLQAMQSREAGDRRASARFYAEFGLGRDSNVNGGTFRDELQLVFGPVNLIGGSSRQLADNQVLLGLGGEKVMRVTGRLSVFAGFDLDHRGNGSAHAYDLSNGGVRIGFTQLAAGALWRVSLEGSELRVGSNRYRDTLQLATEASFTPAQDLAMSAFAQYAEFRHAQADEVRDARATTLGVAATRSLPGLGGEPSLGLRLSWTEEQNQRLRSDLSRQVPLLRLSASVSPTEKLRLSLGLTTYRQKYGNTDPAFGSVRKDRALGVDAVANLAIDARWSLRADAMWTRNESNQDLYDSRRKAASLKLRYQY